MKILFRTAGGQAKKKELGLGHIYRCISLASALKSHEIHFLLEDYGKVRTVLLRKGHKNIFALKNGISLNSDIKKTVQYIKKKKIDILIVDKYGAKIKYLKGVRKYVKIVFISDLWNIDYPADLVVNGFIGFNNKIIKNRFASKCLVGPAYQVLNEEYTKKTMHSKKKYTLLATFGGFDEHNIVEILLRSLIEFHDKIKTKIILGPATEKTKEISQIERRYQKSLKIIDQTMNMHKEISSSEYGICGGGITTYEFASMNVPFAIVCQYKHQIITAREWQKRGIALNLGLANKQTPNKIRKFAQTILEGKVQFKSHKFLVDGLGSQRVSKEILKLKSS